jgi:hypothetical protein
MVRVMMLPDGKEAASLAEDVTTSQMNAAAFVASSRRFVEPLACPAPLG